VRSFDPFFFQVETARRIILQQESKFHQKNIPIDYLSKPRGN
jgi:hypothetical protein